MLPLLRKCKNLLTAIEFPENSCPKAIRSGGFPFTFLLENKLRKPAR